jgi:hypothetical protein
MQFLAGGKKTGKALNAETQSAQRKADRFGRGVFGDVPERKPSDATLKGSSTSAKPGPPEGGPDYPDFPISPLLANT